MNQIMRKLAKLGPILFVSVFIGMQFVPTPGISKTSTAGTHSTEMINPQVRRVLDRSCQDCHSNRTAWPWYSHVAPVSWVISKHVNEGREMLDFSEWTNQPPAANERMLICDAVSDGRMPLPEYTVIHRNARLSKSDVELICEWAAAPSTPITSMHVGKLTNQNK
jgi:hypothetical protein